MKTTRQAWKSGVVACLAFMLVLAALAEAAYPPCPVGRGGAVASAERAATRVGIEVLDDGGNAADAAVAVALVLAVVHPQAGNLGGGGFAVVRFGESVETLDFREVAPAAATRDMFLGDAGEPASRKSLIGPLAAGVPGSPTGLFALHARHGALPWKSVVAPAVRLARTGFVVSERLSRSLGQHRDLLERFPSSREVWLPDDRVPKAGSTMCLPELARTLEGYAERGPEGVMEGRVARAVEAASSAHGGVLTAEDLATYRPLWREPVQFKAFGWNVASMGLPSSGGLILGMTAASLEELRWVDEPRFGSGRAHLLVEAWRLAFADRYLLGDPETTDATEAELLAPARIRRRSASIDRAVATPSSEVDPRGTPLPREALQTTHLSVVDGEGNAVSLTTTLNGSFGCGLVVEGAGFLLNNEMDDFATRPGAPNLYGLVQGEANVVAPGKRMLSSMSPTVAWRSGDVIALGSPGGSRIPNATLQVFLSFVVDGDQLQAAVGRPRFHHQWLPDRIDAEPHAFAPDTRAVLEKMGHTIRRVDSLGCVNVARRRADGRTEGAADPRGPGCAAVVEPSGLPELREAGER